MDQLCHLGNKIFDSYLDLGVFKQDPEKNWRFLPRWNLNLVKKTFLGVKILGPPIAWRYRAWITKFLTSTKLGNAALAGFVVYYFITTFFEEMDKQRQKRFERFLELNNFGDKN